MEIKADRRTVSSRRCPRGGATSTATPRLSRGHAGVEAREGGGGCVTGKSYEGWMGPIQMGTTPRLCLITFCYTWWYRMEVMRGLDGTYSKGNPPSRLCLTTFCHTWTFHILYMRGKGLLHSKRSIFEVGRCPCSNLTYGYRFYSER
jgi:hypothetical protein